MKYISKCCHSEVTTNIEKYNLPDDRGSTYYHICKDCGTACDVLAEDTTVSDIWDRPTLDWQFPDEPLHSIVASLSTKSPSAEGWEKSFESIFEDRLITIPKSVMRGFIIGYIQSELDRIVEVVEGYRRTRLNEDVLEAIDDIISIIINK